MTVLGTLGFCKKMSGIWVYFWLETKTMFMLFLIMFLHLPFHPKLSSTNVTSITSSMCFVMCKRHLENCYVTCVENDSRKKRKLQNTAKKAQAYFGSQLKISRFQTSFTKSNSSFLGHRLQ